MVTLQAQIGGSLHRRGTRPGPAGIGSLVASPEVPEGAIGCIVLPVKVSETQTINVKSCPTKYSIIQKTALPGPPYPMQVFGDRGYAITAFWSTGTAFFMQTTDRKIIALRSDGSAKVYRPRKHIVVSSNPRVKNLVRARDRLDVLSKRLRGAIGARALSSGRGKKR